MRVNIQGLIDNAKCYAMVREFRWPEQVECPHCHATQIAKVLFGGSTRMATTKRNRIVNAIFAACAIAPVLRPDDTSTT